MALFGLSRWRPRHLLLSWIAYWVLLVAGALAPALPAIWRATHLPSGQGQISASVNDAVISLTVQESGRTTWTGSAHLLLAALWIAIPPLLLWTLWLAAKPRQRAEGVRAELRG